MQTKRMMCSATNGTTALRLTGIRGPKTQWALDDRITQCGRFAERIGSTPAPGRRS